MSPASRYTIGGALAIAVTIGIALLSSLPYTAERNPRAVVRLSWRVLGEQVQECRRLTPEELARLPAHMRQEVECEGRVAPYRLTVLVDGVLADSGLIRASGAREDRPIYVFREIEVEPGEHRLEIAFVSERPEDAGQPTGESPADPGTGAISDTAPRSAARRAVPAPSELHLDVRLALDSREIALVAYDRDRRELLLKTSSQVGLVPYPSEAAPVRSSLTRASSASAWSVRSVARSSLAWPSRASASRASCPGRPSRPVTARS